MSSEKIESNNSKSSVDTWFEAQPLLPSTQKKEPIIHPIREVFMNEINFIADMQQLKNALAVMQEKLSPKGLELISNHIAKIDALITASNQWNLVSILTPTITPNEVIKGFQAKFIENPSFELYNQKLAELEGGRIKINDFFQKNQHGLSQETSFINALTSISPLSKMEQTRNLTDLTSLPFQRIARFQMPLEPIQKAINKAPQGYDDLSENIAQTMASLKETALNTQATTAKILADNANPFLQLKNLISKIMPPLIKEKNPQIQENLKAEHEAPTILERVINLFSSNKTAASPVSAGMAAIVRPPLMAEAKAATDAVNPTITAQSLTSQNELPTAVPYQSQIHTGVRQTIQQQARIKEVLETLQTMVVTQETVSSKAQNKETAELKAPKSHINIDSSTRSYKDAIKQMIGSKIHETQNGVEPNKPTRSL